MASEERWKISDFEKTIYEFYFSSMMFDIILEELKTEVSE